MNLTLDAKSSALKGCVFPQKAHFRRLLLMDVCFLSPITSAMQFQISHMKLAEIEVPEGQY